MIKALLVDDSETVLEHLKYILRRDGRICVVGTAKDGRTAVEMVQKKRPDVVSMDIYMPGLDGFEATKRIMETCPVPVVIVSTGVASGDVQKSFEAMKHGAVAAIKTPCSTGHVEFAAEAATFVNTLKSMSEVNVVRRLSKYRSVGQGRPTGSVRAVRQALPALRVVAMGSSTGGPPALLQILSVLDKRFPFSIMSVQHISAGFLPSFVEWLSRSADVRARIARQGDVLLPGHVYFAPDDHHMGVSAGGRISLSTTPPENGLRPAVSHLFRSVLKSYGRAAAGILLTGMGRDGAAELLDLRNAGALTIAQDEESSVVFGMPGEAVKLKAACHVLAPEDIAHYLNSIPRI